MVCEDNIDFNVDSHAVHLIHVGDIRKGARSRVQADIDALGWLAPHFRVVWITDALTREGLPPMYYIDEDGETPLDAADRRKAVDMAPLRRDVPVNNDIISYHSMRYEETADHHLAVARSYGSACYAVMKYGEIEDRTSLSDSFDPGHDSILGLWDRVSDLVVPLAERSVLVLSFHGSGYDINIDVRDDESLKLLMRRYPSCFAEYPDESTIERGIEQCESILGNVISENINLYTETHPSERERRNSNA